jgi:hypothetical protein
VRASERSAVGRVERERSRKRERASKNDRGSVPLTQVSPLCHCASSHAGLIVGDADDQNTNASNERTIHIPLGSGSTAEGGGGTAPTPLAGVVPPAHEEDAVRTFVSSPTSLFTPPLRAVSGGSGGSGGSGSDVGGGDGDGGDGGSGGGGADWFGCRNDFVVSPTSELPAAPHGLPATAVSTSGEPADSEAAPASPSSPVTPATPLSPATPPHGTSRCVNQLFDPWPQGSVSQRAHQPLVLPCPPFQPSLRLAMLSSRRYCEELIKCPAFPNLPPPAHSVPPLHLSRPSPPAFYPPPPSPKLLRARHSVAAKCHKPCSRGQPHASR